METISKKQKIYDKKYFLVAGQSLEIQKDLSLVTKKILLIPFQPYGGCYVDDNERSCPLLGTYADIYWHKFEEVKEINSEHFLIENDIPYKILNYNDVKYNSLDNPSNDLRCTCKRNIVYQKDDSFLLFDPSSANTIYQMYAIVLDYNENGIKAFSWDCLQKFIEIKEKKENLSQAFFMAFNETKTYSKDIYKIEELDAENVNFLNFKIKCPRTIYYDKEKMSYIVDFNLENAVYEYRDLLSM